jgi:hypothetical protein
LHKSAPLERPDSLFQSNTFPRAARRRISPIQGTFMAHPVDPIVNDYHATFNELAGVNAELKKLEPLLKKKADLEATLAKYRTDMVTVAAQPVIPEPAK